MPELRHRREYQAACAACDVSIIGWDIWINNRLRGAVRTGKFVGHGQEPLIHAAGLAAVLQGQTKRPRPWGVGEGRQSGPVALRQSDVALTPVSCQDQDNFGASSGATIPSDTPSVDPGRAPGSRLAKCVACFVEVGGGDRRRPPLLHDAQTIRLCAGALLASRRQNRRQQEQEARHRRSDRVRLDTGLAPHSARRSVSVRALATQLHRARRPWPHLVEFAQCFSWN